MPKFLGNTVGEEFQANTYTEDSNNNQELSDIRPDALTILKDQFDTLSTWYPDVLLEIELACKFFLNEPTK